MKKYLNLGCGHHFSKLPEWTNVDFVSTGEGVIAYDLLNGIPFKDAQFDLVYHSHVLEHFSKDDGETFLKECLRVLKPGGVIRIAVPDLEAIVRNYLNILRELKSGENDETLNANYDWTMIELYDQAVRNKGGGKMGEYLYQPELLNEDFVFKRLGEEARQIRKQFSEERDRPITRNEWQPGLLRRLKDKLKIVLLRKLNTSKSAVDIGNFRLKGEVHQWMYDIHSITRLLVACGGISVQLRTAFESYILEWKIYHLDDVSGKVRKPDSLFVEAIKH